MHLVHVSKGCGWTIWRAGLAVLVLAATVCAPDAIPSRALTHPADWNSLLAQMTLEEKVGQLFLITIYSSTLDQADRALITAVQPGGVVLFPQNLGTPQQVTQLINALQRHVLTVGSGLPVLVAVDQEGGQVTRLRDGFTLFPAPLMIGATGSREDAVMLGYAMGQEMATVGINMNLAPVADLQNPAQDSNEMHVLYRRTMSSDPTLVGQLAGGLVEGMQQAGVIGVLKHYPGHGAAIEDSHSGLPEVDQPLDVVEETAIRAFETAIDDGAPAVMVGHLYYPALDPAVRRPATLSPVVIGDLRINVGFGGLIISDAMDMGAILNERTLSGAIIEALNAGVDMIAFGPHVTAADQQSAVAAVGQAVRDGVIHQTRLDDAVRRALEIRQQYGLMSWTPLDETIVGGRLGLAEHQAVLQQVALDAVTLLDNSQRLLPLEASDRHIALLYPADYGDIRRECAQYDPGVEAISYTYQPTEQEISNAVQVAARADVVAVFVEDLARNGQQDRLVWALPPDKTVVVAMRSPYDWQLLPVPLSTVVLTYDSTPAARAAACQVLYGVSPPKGRLPVALGPYPVGAGTFSAASIHGFGTNSSLK